ncbi:unnamed protein product [Paramecium pentaurelia]|uniref:Uncharacterized protein n=1 Tax=Paramecium pentaurelia TaxID=43138 RepID=A0A8S1W5K9_9CILI|nr:unnamed protein product [Paramecium pentaurelia]
MSMEILDDTSIRNLGLGRSIYEFLECCQILVLQRTFIKKCYKYKYNFYLLKMFSCDIVAMPNKYSRYLGSSVSQPDQPSSSRIKKPNSKFKLLSLHTIKKDEIKNFYHHSSIYNIKEYKDLIKSPVFFFESNTTKLTDLQTRVLITDFQRKVAAYLLNKKLSNSKNMRKYYAELKAACQQKEFESQQIILHTQPQDNHNKVEQQEIGIEIMLMDNNKIIGKQVIPNERIQNRLLKYMDKYLNDDQIDYETKIHFMTQQYSEIVKKIKTKAFKIKVPENYTQQMIDEYAQISDKKKREQFDQQFDQLADQIIQTIHQSSETISSQKVSQTDLQNLDEDIQINMKTQVLTEQLQQSVEYQEDFEEELNKNQRKFKKIIKYDTSNKNSIKKQSIRIQNQSDPDLISSLLDQKGSNPSDMSQELIRSKNKYKGYLDNNKNNLNTDYDNLVNEQNQKLTNFVDERYRIRNISRNQSGQVEQKDLIDLDNQQIKTDYLQQKDNKIPRRISQFDSNGVKNNSNNYSHQQNSSLNIYSNQENSKNKKNTIQDEISQKIEQQLQQVQSVIQKKKFGVLDKLLDAQSVFDVDICLADFPLNKSTSNNGQEDKQIFQQLFAWQKEITQIIPILNQLNRKSMENESIYETKSGSSDDNN